MLLDHLLPALFILVLGSTVQASVGFGAGMVTMPLLALTGIPLYTAMGLLLPSNFVQSAVNFAGHRKELSNLPIWPVFFQRLVGLLIGVWVLGLLVVDSVLAKQVIGAALLVAVAIHAVVRVAPRPSVPAGWATAASVASGFTAGLVMMGAPPLVLWVMAHDWSPNRQRAFLWGQFLMIMPIHAVILVSRFGVPVAEALGWGLLLTPAGWIGAKLGNIVSKRMSAQRLRWGMIMMLTAVGLYALLGGSSMLHRGDAPRNNAVRHNTVLRTPSVGDVLGELKKR